MELEDLKNTWEATNAPAEKRVTSAMMDDITQARYRSSLKRIAYPELAGVVVCLSAAIFLTLHLHTLGTIFLQGVGVLGILLLLAVSIISLLSIWPFGKPADVNTPHVEMLRKFAVQKIQFLQLQKANFLISYLLLVVTVVLLSGFFNGSNLTRSPYFWIFSICGGYIFLLFYSRWVDKHYKRTLRQTEALLQELH